MTATMQGIPVHLSPVLPDGQIALSTDLGDPFGTEQSILWIGTAPLSDREQLRRDARLTVRRGLADVLTWLGQAVENEPTGVELWDALMREGER